MWQEKYVGIPFKPNGRDESGLDCWGLVRLIYDKEYNIDLPSFNSEYVIEDDNRIKELISQYKEGWEPVEIPSTGSVVLFKIFGDLTHIGVMISDTEFIHVREGSNTVIDSINNIRWKNRVTGYFKYSEKAGVVLNAVPHPLKTTRITTIITEGTSLEELYEKVNKENLIDPNISKTVNIMVNGVVVPRILWNTTYLKNTDVVEYRAVPGKEAIKIVALIVLVVYAPEIAFELGKAMGAEVGASAAAFAQTTAGKIAAATVVVAGSSIINAIAPVRPPTSEDPGNPEQQDLITGANNQYNPYGSIPVVLGKCRVTPPLGAKSFISYPEERESYLNMLLVWGYGPLTLTNFRIGEVDWDNYQYNVTMPNSGRITFDRKTPLTQTQLDDFDKIYGNDVTQQYSNLEMIGPEWTQTGSGSTVTSTLINGTGVTFDKLTGIVISPPEDVIPEIPVEPY